VTDPAPLQAASEPSNAPVIGYLGPQGTFTEQALLSQPDLATGSLRPLNSISDVIAATSGGDIDLGFVPIENAIEGSVNVTIDALAFEAQLLIQREVVISIELDLLAPPGATLGDVEKVLSMPMATAQCRLYLNEHLPGVELEATNSTADAARIVGERGDPTCAAISPRRAGELHGLEALANDVEDHPDNQTRFVAVAPAGIPSPTGHDKTMIIVFQRADRPGNLLTILQEFAARSINLTKLESRPTKKGLGDYCFIIDLEGHISDELVADCLRNIRSKQEDVKFVGSFPAAGDHGPQVRRDAGAAWQDAAAWIDGLRSQVDG
jgi:prephenate dehydratase